MGAELHIGGGGDAAAWAQAFLSALAIFAAGALREIDRWRTKRVAQKDRIAAFLTIITHGRAAATIARNSLLSGSLTKAQFLGLQRTMAALDAVPLHQLPDEATIRIVMILGDTLQLFLENADLALDLEKLGQAQGEAVAASLDVLIKLFDRLTDHLVATGAPKPTLPVEFD
jgi:hypothetical protein